MKIKRYILAILITVPVLSFSQFNPDSLFDEANKLYSEEDYESSIKAYKSIIIGGYESSELYYNVGNAYFKTRNYPLSILNYERALLLNPGDENIEHNLAKSRMYIIDKIDEIPQFILKKWANKLIMVLTSNSWAILSLITFILALALLLMYFLAMKIRLKKTGFYGALIMLFVAMTSFYFSSKAMNTLIDSTGAIIIAPTVTVKSSPREKGTDLFIVHEGTKVFILNQLDKWYEVELTDGKQGWLLKSEIETI